jgi:hypothetical protein
MYRIASTREIWVRDRLGASEGRITYALHASLRLPLRLRLSLSSSPPLRLSLFLPVHLPIDSSVHFYTHLLTLPVHFSVVFRLTAEAYCTLTPVPQE